MKKLELDQENNMANKAKQSVNDPGDIAAKQAKAETLAGQGQQKLNEVTQQTSDTLDSAAHQASGLLHSVAGSLHSHAPDQGKAGEITQQFVEGLEQGSSFLEEQSRKGIVTQTTNMVLGIAFLASLAVVGVVVLAWLGSRRQ
jgi:hypothetical protein